MRSLEKSLTAYLRKAKAPLRDGLAVADLAARWEEIIGHDAALHSRPVSLKGGLLTVECSNPSWANELSFLSRKVLDAVNGPGGRKRVRKVMFRAGKGS